MDDLDQATRALASTEVKTPDARETSDLRPTQALVDLYIADPETEEAGATPNRPDFPGGSII